MITTTKQTYNGGKAGNGTYQNIINHLPACSVFIDGMVGNGGILKNFNLPGTVIINDLSKDQIESIQYTGKSRLIKENMHVVDLIEKYNYDTGKLLFYFDPPYLKSTRKNQQDLYKFEMTILQHEQFLEAAVKVKHNCMISHYPCQLYDEALQGWHRFLFQSTTRRGSATECIYMNYPKPDILQDYRYIGNNFTRRQQIKRQQSRIVKKFEAMQAIERNNILTVLIEKFNYDRS